MHQPVCYNGKEIEAFGSCYSMYNYFTEKIETSSLGKLL